MQVEFQMYAKGSRDQVMILRDSNDQIVKLKPIEELTNEQMQYPNFRSFKFRHRPQNENDQEINFLGLVANDESLEVRSFYIKLV